MGEGRWAGLLGGGGREAAAPRGGVEEVLIIELRDDCQNASLLQWSLLWYSHAFFLNSHTSPKQLLIL
jgi:hypothetical protein